MRTLSSSGSWGSRAACLGRVHHVHRRQRPRHLALHLRSLFKQRHMENGCSCSPAATFCSVHIHNKVAKTRYASTSLLHRLHAHVVQHNVGDSNMSALSTVSDVFSDPEFMAPGNALLWGVGGLDESCKNCTGFLIMSKRPYAWRVDLDFAPRDQTAHLPAFLHLRVTNLPGPDSIMRSSQAQQRRLERATTKNDRTRLHKRLAQQAASNPLATQPKSTTSQCHTPPRLQHSASTAPTGKLNASASAELPIGSGPQRPLCMGSFSASHQYLAPLSHLSPHHVVSQFHAQPMLLSFSVVSRHFYRPGHIRIASRNQWLTSRLHGDSCRVPRPALGPEYSSAVLLLSRDCALCVARGPARRQFPMCAFLIHPDTIWTFLLQICLSVSVCVSAPVSVCSCVFL